VWRSEDPYLSSYPISPDIRIYNVNVLQLAYGNSETADRRRQYLSGPHKRNTTAIQEKFLYCSCIVVVMHLCGPLYRQTQAAEHLMYGATGRVPTINSVSEATLCCVPPQKFVG